MAATTARPWEVNSSQSPPSHPPPALPSISALTNGLPDAGSSGLSSPVSTRERDSGAWSQPQSTRSSTYSTNTSSYPMSSATNSYYMSPNRISNLSNNSGHGAMSHASTDYAGVTSGPSMSSPGYAHHGGLPAIDRHHHDPHHDTHRQSVASQGSQPSEGGFPPQESRRSSIGSQVNLGMTSLQINGATSPYQSVNHSSTSLAQNLFRERGIPALGGLRSARSTAQLMTSPMSSNAADQRPATGYGRVAPAITHNPGSNVYNAPDPLPGQAYAFPDPGDLEPGALPPKSATGRHIHSSDGNRPILHRRDSGHTSIASSVTDSSRLPPGQHRLDDSVPGTPHHHHHSLQSHGGMSDVQEDEAMTPEDSSSQPYSRTPALRVSHKMAERKRRSEMKDLFENLRSQIPTNQGSKSSKWEILTKASDYIKQLESMNQSAHQADKQLRLAMHDVELTRRDNDKLRNENQRLIQEIQRFNLSAAAQASGQGPPPPQAAAPIPPQPVQQQQPGPQSQPGQQPGFPPHYSVAGPPQLPSALHDPSRSLPPLVSGPVVPPSPVNTANANNSMQGVQYTHEQR